jgi:hypothetical protein
MGRLLLVVLVLAVVCLLIALPLLLGGYGRYGAIVVGVAVVLGALAGVSLRLVRRREPAARRLSMVTGVATVVLSVPLMPVWVGLLTAVAGIGVMVVTVAPERTEDPA